ncbi:hypothetical protein [Alicyclobacillus sendaiensis]|uniref:hypothetical protein n=1 Tax=Alicyclobacillus sendaiensis TaxID=192387 RepID=UPI0026F475AF|nr:hypothetical protein [Alicyclobacillus sendaiensis]
MARQLEDSPLDAIVEQLGRWDVASARLVALLARSGGRHALGAALDHHEGLQRIRRQVMAMCHHPGRLGSGAPQARHARLAALAAHGEAFHWECAAIESLLDRSRQAGEQTAVERQQDGAIAISRLVSKVALRVEEAGTADLAAAWARLRQE